MDDQISDIGALKDSRIISFTIFATGAGETQAGIRFFPEDPPLSSSKWRNGMGRYTYLPSSRIAATPNP